MCPVKRAGQLSLAVAALAAGWSSPASANHSFDVAPASIQACLDGVQFVGQPTANSSLGLALTPRAGVPTIVGGAVVATTPVASGQALTFTTVGQTRTFSVAYAAGTFIVGAPIVLGVTNSPSDPIISDGTEGWASHTAMLSLTVGNCLLGLVAPGAGNPVAIPSGSPWSSLVLALILGVVVWLRQRRSS